VPGPCEWPECEKPLEGGAGVADGGRLKFIAGTVKMRWAEAPSAGHDAAWPASRMGRDTSNSSLQRVQRNG
jgi:hypothetical protein